jgi:hypothetical protein
VVTELRVHGVTGTPAESMLDRPLLRRVAGDTEAGFFRPRVEYGGTTGPGGAALEAYRWGNLTAGAATRALWLLLLPFMFANVALWLRPRSGKAGTIVMRALSRIFALSITSTFVLSLAGISLDLVAWQCAAQPRCVGGRWYLQPFVEGFFAPTGRRLALTAIVPILAVAFLWYLGRRTWSRYEAYPATESGDGDGLAHPCFWNGRPLVGRLRSIHVAVAFATLDAVLLAVLLRRDRATGDAWYGMSLAELGSGLAIATVAVMLLAVLAVCLRAVMHRDAPAKWALGYTRLLRWLAILLTLATLTYAMAPRQDWDVAGGLPGFAPTLTYLFAAQAGLLALLGLVILVVRERGSYLFGLTAPIMGSLGLGVAVAFSAGLSFRVADFLDRGGLPSPADYLAPRSTANLKVQPPIAFEWAALGFVVFLVVLAFVAFVVRPLLMRRLRRYGRVVTDADFRGWRAKDKHRAGQIDEAIADALLTDHVGRLVAWGYIPLGIAAAGVTVLAIAGQRPVQLAVNRTFLADVISISVNAGTYLIGLAALALLVVGVLAYRYQRFRRVVGVLWDLGTFWPRSGHPLAPPCYAERVVPELVTRAGHLAEQGGLVLSGHSQGSVLVAATVLQLQAHQQAGVALVTYGSPLRRLYARLFPSYVDDALLARVGAAVSGQAGSLDASRPRPAQPGGFDQRARWVNLWRDTDPIGGPVNAPAHDVRLVDPIAFGFPPGDSVFPEVGGHSSYQLHPAFGDAVRSMVESVPGGQARSGQSGQALPGQPQPGQPHLPEAPVLA